MSLNKPVSSFLIGLSLFSAFLNTSSAAIDWQGTADYSQALTAEGDEDVVADFGRYDFGGGVLLIKSFDINTIGIGSVIEGYYQTYVNSHLQENAGIAAPNLNITGSGIGYELTMIADFSATIVDVSLYGVSFADLIGNATLYFDTTPDYSFSADSGFADGTPLMISELASGSGFISPFGFGAAQMELSFASVNANVYDPDTIGSATALFALAAGNSGIASVAGQTVSQGDLLFAVDGSLQLQQAENVPPVPLPLPVWLFGSAALLWTSTRHRRLKAAD